MKPPTKLPHPACDEIHRVKGIFGRQWFLAVALRASTPPRRKRPAEARAA